MEIERYAVGVEEAGECYFSKQTFRLLIVLFPCLKRFYLKSLQLLKLIYYLSILPVEIKISTKNLKN